MSRAYIYMEDPATKDLVTPDRLTLKGAEGEFLYAPDHVKRGGWVPDPINSPLRSEAYAGITKNPGVPGFINDAMPDGWGERLFHRAFGQALATIDYLLKSPNNERIGNLMTGTATIKPLGSHLQSRAHAPSPSCPLVGRPTS